MKAAIYLIVQFNFPTPFKSEYGDMARALHNELGGQEWVQEVLAGSGGIGGEQGHIWIFKLADYAGLDDLLHGEDAVAQAYQAFFRAMDDVREFIREEVLFL